MCDITREDIKIPYCFRLLLSSIHFIIKKIKSFLVWCDCVTISNAATMSSSSLLDSLKSFLYSLDLVTSVSVWWKNCHGFTSMLDLLMMIILYWVTVLVIYTCHKRFFFCENSNGFFKGWASRDNCNCKLVMSFQSMLI